MGKIRQIRVRKDYFLEGYYSVHDAKFVNGKLVSESLIDYAKTKKRAYKIKDDYKKGKLKKVM